MLDFTHGTVQANGLTFHYLEAGQGPLALCLHGFPDHARSFRHQLPALAEAGYRAVAPFMRGYAPTAVPADGPYQTAVLAQDAVALIEALSPDAPAVAIGHDWGALAAYGAALLAPHRIAKLAAVAVPYGPQVMQAVVTDYAQSRRSWHMFFFQSPIADAAVAHDDFAFLERLWRDWSPGWDIPGDELEAVKATFRQSGVLQAALGYYRQTFQPTSQQPEIVALQARIMTTPIEVPTLVVHGANDGCIGSESLAGTERWFPRGCRIEVVDDAGHFVHQERPETFNRVLLEFLR